MRGLVVCFALAACGGSSPPPAEPAPPPPAATAPAPATATPPGTAGPDVDALMTKMQAFTDQMCACKDQGCAQQVATDLQKWGEDVSKQSPEPPKFTDDQTKHLQAIGEQMGTCMQKAMGAGASQPAP